MPSPIVQEPDDVDRLLAEFGLVVEDLHEPLRRAQLARDLCTDNHPPGYRGMAAWGEGNAGLRDRLAPAQWTRSNRLNIPRTVSPDKTMAITMIAGDKNTATTDSGLIPQPKRPRREASQRLVINNLQGSLDLYPGQEDDPDSEAKLWYLLWYRKGEVVRCELSQPTAVDANGVIEAYLSRIILPGLDLSQGPPPGFTGDREPDLDVPVQRRVS